MCSRTSNYIIVCNCTQVTWKSAFKMTLNISVGCLDFHRVTLTKFSLKMLRSTNAPEVTIHHNSQACTKSFTFLHTEDMFNCLCYKHNVYKHPRLIFRESISILSALSYLLDCKPRLKKFFFIMFAA